MKNKGISFKLSTYCTVLMSIVVAPAVHAVEESEDSFRVALGYQSINTEIEIINNKPVEMAGLYGQLSYQFTDTWSFGVGGLTTTGDHSTSADVFESPFFNDSSGNRIAKWDLKQVMYSDSDFKQADAFVKAVFPFAESSQVEFIATGYVGEMSVTLGARYDGMVEFLDDAYWQGANEQQVTENSLEAYGFEGWLTGDELQFVGGSFDALYRYFESEHLSMFAGVKLESVYYEPQYNEGYVKQFTSYVFGADYQHNEKVGVEVQYQTYGEETRLKVGLTYRL
jgi:hypothetical protein